MALKSKHLQTRRQTKSFQLGRKDSFYWKLKGSQRKRTQVFIEVDLLRFKPIVANLFYLVQINMVINVRRYFTLLIQLRMNFNFFSINESEIPLGSAQKV